MPENAQELSKQGSPASDHKIGQTENCRTTVSKRTSITRSGPPVSAAGKNLAVRSVQPEILDRLPQFSTAARASRRDLRVINGFLGCRAWFADALRRRHRTGEAVLEIGSGTGELGRALNRIAPGLAGLDLGRRPADWPRDSPWFETDVLQFTGWKNYPVVVANLFFHHFGRADLARLGAQLNAHTRLIIANDPVRSRRSQVLFSLLCPLIRAHQVTRHDGRVSIAAGFRHEELPRLLQLDPAVWSWCVEATWLGSARLVAVRRT